LIEPSFEELFVDDQIADHGQPRQRPYLDGSFTSLRLVTQASPFLPLIFIASTRTHPRGAAAKRQRVILRLHPDERVEQHSVSR
jgi:hypothetical protein